jgi:hypothetical protein
MTRTLLVVALALGCSAASADVFDDALGKAGLTKQTARFDPLDVAVYGGDVFRLPYFDVYHRDPYRAPDRVKLFQDQVGRAAGKAFDIVGLASRCLDAEVRRGLLGDPAAEFARKSEEKDGLAASVLALWEASGKKPPRRYQNRLRAGALQVPPDLAKTAAMLLYAEADAIKWRNLAFRRLSERYKLQDLYVHILEPGQSDFDFIRDDLMRLTDLKLLFTGAENLAAAVDKAVDALSHRQKDSADFHFEADTPFGKVVLDGAGDDVYPAGQSYALLIDTAGDDTYYSGAATTSAADPVSILIDLAGSDKYLETPELERKELQDFPARKGWHSRPNSCAAVMGCAFLVDLAGDDRYAAINNTQAYAGYGVAVLMDCAGNDTYNCYQTGQGSALFGIAALSDRAGDDTYRCFTTSQGFGGTKGFGLLVDGAGNDSYTAEVVQIDFPSAQDPKHNGNLAQGVGCGERADFTTGHSLAGGIGTLVDLAGNDNYVSDIMAPGMGYWFGLGILADGGGNDSYTGYWYNQGSAAHFAVGILYDASGDDVYRAPCSMVQGAGHDYSLGFLIDEAGSDSYTAAGISLGGGNANGIGIFWDKSGDDSYHTSANVTLGRANIASRGSARDFDLCLGLFLDTDGNDSYTDAYPFAKNNASWLQKGQDTEHPLATEVGVGVDTTSGN